MMRLRVDPELEAIASGGSDDLKKVTAQPAGALEEEKIKVAAPSSLKRKEPENIDEDAVLIRRLKNEAMALIVKGAQPEDARRWPARKRKKYIKERLPQGLIDHMIQRPHRPIPDISPEKLAQRANDFREFYLQRKAIADKIFEYEQALITQYLAKGYADDEVEVTDDEEE